MLKLTTYFNYLLLKLKLNNIRFEVNSIKLSRRQLYFSSTNQQLVGWIKATCAKAALTNVSLKIIATSILIDDFIVNDLSSDIYIVKFNLLNKIRFVSKDAYGFIPVIIASGPNTTALLGPTAAVQAKGAVGKTLLILAIGGFQQFFTGNYTRGGKVAVVYL